MRIWLPWTAAAAVALFAANWVGHGFSLHLIPVALLLLATPKLAGDAVRARRLRVETLEARVSLAEQETLRRVAEERLRIAREVHDVVAHALVAITCARASPTTCSTATPSEAREALRASSGTRARRWPSCARRSACCATTAQAAPSVAPGAPGSRTCRGWSTACATPAGRDARRRRGAGTAVPESSPPRATASCRRR